MINLEAPNIKTQKEDSVSLYNNKLVDLIVKQDEIAIILTCVRQPETPNNLLISEQAARLANNYLTSYLIGRIYPTHDRDKGAKQYKATFSYHKDSGNIYGEIKFVKNQDVSKPVYDKRKPKHRKPKNRYGKV